MCMCMFLSQIKVEESFICGTFNFKANFGSHYLSMWVLFNFKYYMRDNLGLEYIGNFEFVKSVEFLCILNVLINGLSYKICAVLCLGLITY